MIDDPIVIRKARGALIVASTRSTDPIQLIRQTSTTEIEVHLKNGGKYVEDVGGVDMLETIMEMMGYVTYEVYLRTKMWPKYREGKLAFRSGVDLHCAGQSAFGTIFSETPYMKNKFLRVSLKKKESEHTYYDSPYSQYDVECMFAFKGRVDMKDEIWTEFQENLRFIVEHLAFGQSAVEDGHATIRSILE